MIELADWQRPRRQILAAQTDLSPKRRRWSGYSEASYDRCIKPEQKRAPVIGEIFRDVLVRPTDAGERFREFLLELELHGTCDLNALGLDPSR